MPSASVTVPLLPPYAVDAEGWEAIPDPPFAMWPIQVELDHSPDRIASKLKFDVSRLRSELRKREPELGNSDASHHRAYYNAVYHQLDLLDGQLDRGQLPAALDQLGSMSETIARTWPWGITVQHEVLQEVQRRSRDQRPLSQQYAEAQGRARPPKPATAAQPVPELPTGMVERHDAICVDLEQGSPAGYVVPELMIAAQERLRDGADVVDVFRLGTETDPVSIRAADLADPTLRARLGTHFAGVADSDVDLDAAAASVFNHYSGQLLSGFKPVGVNLGYVHATNSRDPSPPAVSRAREQQFLSRYRVLSEQAGDVQAKLSQGPRRQAFTGPDPTGRGGRPSGTSRGGQSQGFT